MCLRHPYRGVLARQDSSIQVQKGKWARQIVLLPLAFPSESCYFFCVIKSLWSEQSWSVKLLSLTFLVKGVRLSNCKFIFIVFVTLKTSVFQLSIHFSSSCVSILWSPNTHFQVIAKKNNYFHWAEYCIYTHTQHRIHSRVPFCCWAFNLTEGWPIVFLN